MFEMDSAPQQAGFASLASTRAVRAAELQYAVQELERNKTLYAAGAVSQRDLSQAETAQRTAEAALKALDEQLRQQKTELSLLPRHVADGGIVGDIPVRQGDRVTKTTVLTTVDENDVLELYVNVPVQQAPSLKVGLPVRIVDDRGHVARDQQDHVRLAAASTPTQTVLAKAALVDGRGEFRTRSIRARAASSGGRRRASRVPLTAVTRINGQYFAYVVEKDGDKTVARQKAGHARRTRSATTTSAAAG